MAHGVSSVNIIKRRCNELNISCDHFKQTGSSVRFKYTLEEILVENSPYKNLSCLKRRLLDAQLLTYECALCHNPGEWLGEPLTL